MVGDLGPGRYIVTVERAGRAAVDSVWPDLFCARYDLALQLAQYAAACDVLGDHADAGVFRDMAEVVATATASDFLTDVRVWFGPDHTATRFTLTERPTA